MSLVMRSWTAVVVAGALAACGSGSTTTTDAAVAADVTTPTDTGSTTPTDRGSTPTDTGSTPTDTGSTTPTDTGSTTADAGPPPTDAAPGPTTVSGSFADNGMGIGGATVALVGASPPVSTSTAANGDWSLPVSSGQTVWVRVSGTGYRSVQRGLAVPVGGTMGFSLDPVSTDNASQIFMLASTPEDTSKGVLVVLFNTADGDNPSTPGFGATISSTSGPRIAIGGGMPQVRDTTTGGENALIFPNVPAGMVTVTPVPVAGFTCALAPGALAPERIDPQVLTFVTFRCR